MVHEGIQGAAAETARRLRARYPSEQLRAGYAESRDAPLLGTRPRTDPGHGLVLSSRTGAAAFVTLPIGHARSLLRFRSAQAAGAGDALAEALSPEAAAGIAAAVAAAAGAAWYYWSTHGAA